MRNIDVNTTEFLNRFQGIMTEIWKLVKRKNEQYATNDALANFTTGAELQYHDKAAEWQFETLKDYMLKHVAHVYNNRLMGNGVRESLGDIATYCIIGMIMHDAIDTRPPEPEEKEAFWKRSTVRHYDDGRRLDGLMSVCDDVKQDGFHGESLFISDEMLAYMPNNELMCSIVRRVEEMQVRAKNRMKVK